ncbi:MAG: DUF4405 domain-containing protein [Gemmatimonadetes bacterium]|jgi:hypothetical protein|nr:DUF4405 domain-containing protein [Gemmatimonadota bacterium]
MNEKKAKEGFYTRGFTTFLLLFAALTIAVSGLVLFVTPRGRVANWTGWTLMGLEKEQWGSVHTNAAFLFIIIAGFHIFFNWKVLLNYIRSRRQVGFRRRNEFVVALGIAVLFVGGSVSELPPFSWVGDLNMGIKDYWEGKTPSGPVAHAEELSVEAFARQIGMPVEEVVGALAKRGIEVESPGVKLIDIAHENGVTPSQIHQWVQPEKEGEASHVGGMGLGRMTLTDYCAAEKVQPDGFIARMKERGIEVKGTMTLKALAEVLKVNPHQVGAMVREMAKE